MIVHMVTGIGLGDARVNCVVEKAKALGLNATARVVHGTHFVTVEVYVFDSNGKSAGEFSTHIFENLPGVESVARVTPSAVRMACTNPDDARRVTIGKHQIGRGLPCRLITGPCTVTRDVGRLIPMIVDTGAMWIRGGCWKPRTRANSFRGFGVLAVEWLLTAARENNVEAIFIEVMDTQHIAQVRAVQESVGFEGAIVLWVGAWTSNQALLEALGKQDRYTVMLKHHPWDIGIDGMITRAEFVLAGEMEWDERGELIPEASTPQGNSNVLLCVRGVNKPESSRHTLYRFMPNAEWISALHQRCWAPVVWDPSHIAGHTDLVWGVLAEGLRYRPEAVMVECWFDPNDPRKPLCDAEQAIPMNQVPTLLKLIEGHNQNLTEQA
ncbi:MAG: hypothetical protein A3H59_03275 [Candidatus Jacksonbacteria bacterium RIFCSPLOWO2_02_FULL_43_9]|nr:MAG: Bifunctional 2-keto-3-deoxy-D-arabino-heptulosonate-7-phosphate synthase/chorismate mutase [Parcubacteria group bacterium GW2011_GWA2_43_13]OGY69470.1 MAG: hypothetical protein A3B94_03305 [Candidatus Jacksonbacteria bacterium RIFCSPHIGHO2_02_FULL_43_10]OGY71351.1 MAG: hypothetical protein A2986_03770 [Candidatus Jacksonbacteria bacterium RIFCSPLOWO2_01_FULL_44_13]OGY73301.1 MAG: hypothetical protein A3H59_03275 [Candidatus Jacksonbacteria bacterium RIFCSPLOWO2_02_FULL_43_9]HAZ17023.1 h